MLTVAEAMANLSRLPGSRVRPTVALDLVEEVTPESANVPPMGQVLLETCGDCLEHVGNPALDERHDGYPIGSVASPAFVPVTFQFTPARFRS
jgi:hypothetical protein